MISNLFLCLAALDGLLLWAICSKGRGFWGAKLAAIIVVFALNFTVIHYRVTGIGWATTGKIPAQSIFVSCYVKEPQKDVSEGGIYLWLIPQEKIVSQFGYSSIPGEPRAYLVPYTRALHEQCVAATKESRQQGAAPVAVRRPSGAKKNAKGRFVFYHLPPPIPQSKGTP